jgi:hypothetical protein
MATCPFAAAMCSGAVRGLLSPAPSHACMHALHLVMLHLVASLLHGSLALSEVARLEGARASNPRDPSKSSSLEPSLLDGWSSWMEPLQGALGRISRLSPWLHDVATSWSCCLGFIPLSLS